MTAKKKVQKLQSAKQENNKTIHKQLLTSKMQILDNYFQLRYWANVIVTWKKFL